MAARKTKRAKLLSNAIRHIGPRQINAILDLLEGFKHTSFQSRNLAYCLDVYKSMLSEKEVVIFLGLSGALIPAGMKKVLLDMIAFRLVDVVVSTGANLSHDFYESMGGLHYAGHSDVRDEELVRCRVDRIYDTYTDDIAFSKLELFFAEFPDELEDRVYSTREFFFEVGKRITSSDSIIKACHEMGIPIFCPALNDSAIGVGLTAYYARGRKRSFGINNIRDNYEILQIMNAAPCTGVVYLGGGVPKNYIQQIGPALPLHGYEPKSHKYGIQITTDDPKWGGLSGCTFDEGKSWGKINTRAQHATVYVDLSIGLPLLITAALEYIERKGIKRKPPNFIWDGDRLTGA